VSVPEQPEKVVGELNCYPNPSNGSDKIKGFLKDGNSKLSELKVYNSIGQLVFSKNIVNQHFEFDVNLTNTGLYLVVVYQNNIPVQSQKWVVE